MLAPASPRGDSRTFERWRSAFEWPMAILALAVIPALLLDDGATQTLHTVANAVNWIVWLAFCGEFLILLALAPRKSAFVRRSWFDLVIIVVSPPFAVPDAFQGFRAARALRVFRLLRALAVLSIGLKTIRRLLRHRRFHYVLTTTCGIVVLGAVGIYVIERHANESITSLGDALWWAVSTTTTVGFGEIVPQTGEGRLIAVLLMLTGIAVVSVFTATLASFFFAEEEKDELEEVKAHLRTIETKLDRLAERQH
jgi:voltage-gated potassium channel